MDVGGGTVVKGKWEQISMDSIRLNTYDQPIQPTTTYVGNKNSDIENKVKITIADLNFPLEGANIWVNDKPGKVADRNGTVEFDITQVETVRYQYLGKDETISIDNPDYDEIEITISDLDMSAVPRFFTDKIMTLKNRELYYNDWFSLKKTNMNQKQWK